MKRDSFQKLVQKYLNGDCTPEEIAAVHDWYESCETERNPVESLSSLEQQQLKQRLLTGIRTKIAGEGTFQHKTGERKRLPATLIYSLSGIAAMLILVMGIVFFRQSTSPADAVSGDIVVVNNTKSIRKLELIDGSIVWLNPGSEIEYPERFTSKQRTVQMKGEAFFEVSPDKSRPFLIYSDQVITRVIGTSFRIRAYENIPVEVSVVTGKVSVSLQEQLDSEITLLPNEKATYSKTVNSLKKEEERETSAIRMWQKATLSFDNEPIRKVIQSLNKRFGVHISSDDEDLLNYVLRADFTDQSLPSILEMLEKSLNLHYEIDGRRIIVKD